MTDFNAFKEESLTAEEMAALQKRAARGAGILVGMRVVVRLIGFISALILARLLTPEDYGIIALASLLHAFLISISEFGFNLAIIRDPNPQRADFDTAWTIKVLRGFALAILILVLTIPFSSFYEQPDLLLVIPCYALMALIGGFENIGIVNFMRDMRYGDDFRFFTISKAAGFIVAVLCAFIFRNYWALVAGSLSLSVARLLLSYILDSYRPRFSLAAFSKLFHFVKWTTLTHGLTYLVSRVDIIILGKVLSSAALGLYYFALEFATVVTTEISLPVTRAVYPALSRMQSDRDQLQLLFARSLFFTVAVTVPLGIGIGIIADPAIEVLLGAKWSGVAPLLQIICIFSVIRVVFELVELPFNTIGRPDIPTKLQCTNLVLRVSALMLTAIYFDIQTVIWSLVLVSGIQLIIVVVTFQRFDILRVSDFVMGVWRPAVGAAAMALVVSNSVIFDIESDILTVISKILAGGVVYIATVFSLWAFSGRQDGSPEAILIGFMKERIDKRRVKNK